MKDTILKDYKAAKKEFSRKAKAALKEVFQDFFAKHPEVQQVRWTQYAPYFNDGDECTFSVNEPRFFAREAPADADEVDLLGMIERATDPWYFSRGYSKTPTREKTSDEERLIEDAEGLSDLVTDSDMADAMEEIFGNHVQVTALRDGEFEVEDYDHD